MSKRIQIQIQNVQPEPPPSDASNFLVLEALVFDIIGTKIKWSVLNNIMRIIDYSIPTWSNSSKKTKEKLNITKKRMMERDNLKLWMLFVPDSQVAEKINIITLFQKLNIHEIINYMISFIARKFLMTEIEVIPVLLWLIRLILPLNIDIHKTITDNRVTLQMLSGTLGQKGWRDKQIWLLVCCYTASFLLWKVSISIWPFSNKISLFKFSL